MTVERAEISQVATCLHAAITVELGNGNGPYETCQCQHRPVQIRRPDKHLRIWEPNPLVSYLSKFSSTLIFNSTQYVSAERHHVAEQACEYSCATFLPYLCRANKSKNSTSVQFNSSAKSKRIRMSLGTMIVTDLGYRTVISATSDPV